MASIKAGKRKGGKLSNNARRTISQGAKRQFAALLGGKGSRAASQAGQSPSPTD